MTAATQNTTEPRHLADGEIMARHRCYWGDVFWNGNLLEGWSRIERSGENVEITISTHTKEEGRQHCRDFLAAVASGGHTDYDSSAGRKGYIVPWRQITYLPSVEDGPHEFGIRL